MNYWVEQIPLTGREAYFFVFGVFVFCFLSLVFVRVLFLKKTKTQSQPLRSGMRWNTWYFIAVNIVLAILPLTLVLIPLVVLKRTSDPSQRPTFLVVFLAGVLMLSFIYAMRKGDLSWDRRGDLGENDMERSP